MYVIVDGVPEDIVLAYMWWNLAAAQGGEGPQSNKDRAERQMTSEQIAEAQRSVTRVARSASARRQLAPPSPPSVASSHAQLSSTVLLVLSCRSVGSGRMKA